ncbi:MAG: 1-aminocyclopropane-1-carboxylate deaminase/D-cysteine desulfhydrase [Flavobacteriaceae bacterium]|nr:1-aminocyclopropane-1-carboxylate deaminase/D-cysteine desulfhydrase [Flavobacteriaceae bacterium]
MDLIQIDKSTNQRIDLSSKCGVDLYLKREDLIHQEISGNKYRKLKYNILEAKYEGLKTLLSFGGAYSNHIAALAKVGKELGLNTIGVIRGEELESRIYDNPTLRFASSCDMRFKFITRESYRDKNNEEFIEELKNEFGSFYLIPEGGTNELAIKGCEEILTVQDKSFDFVCCSVGTGGTISGIINSSLDAQKILGFPALKGSFLEEEIRKYSSKNNWKLITDYHFGGYAKINEELIAFINEFKSEHEIALDPVYTGKMMFGIMDLLKKGFFPKGSRVLAIHTGGLQGIAGMNNALMKKQLPLIK